jgi:hypothetical protein
VRPPFIFLNLTGCDQASTHGGVRDRSIKNVENNPMHSSDMSRINGLRIFRIGFAPSGKTGA